MDFSRFAFKGTSSSRTEDCKDRVDQKSVQSTHSSSSISEPNPVLKSQPEETEILSTIRVKELYTSPGQTIERPLRLLIVGHNPSSTSWERGHYYAHPSNRMWHLLTKFGIVPKNYVAANDQDCPASVGVGFTDVAYGIPETQSSGITDALLCSKSSDFYRRVLEHCQRVQRSCDIPLEECVPRVIAFAGVRQFKALFGAESRPKKRPASQLSSASEKDNSEVTLFGPQVALPLLWPALLRSSKVVLLPSSSGASAIATSVREAPYEALGHMLKQLKYVWSEDWQCDLPIWESESVEPVALNDGKTPVQNTSPEVIDLIADD